VAPFTPEPSAPLYSTELTETSLPEILAKIYQYRAPGRLDCRRRSEVKRIYLEKGEIVFATTNQLSEALGARLLSEGRITKTDYDASLVRVRATGKRHGTALVEMKLLTPDELTAAVQAQIEAIVWSVFAWEAGSVGFTPGRDKRLEFIKMRISVPNAVMFGVRRMPDAKSIVARLGSRSTVYSRTNLELEGHTPDEAENRLLEQVDGKRPLSDLVNTAPIDPADNARLLFGMLTLGLIAVREPKQIKVRMTTEVSGKYE
jgi:hypothetical protein